MNVAFQVADRVMGTTRVVQGMFGTITGFQLNGKRPMVVASFDGGHMRTVSRSSLQRVENVAVPADVPIIEAPQKLARSPSLHSSSSSGIPNSDSEEEGDGSDTGSESDESQVRYSKIQHL